MNLGYLNSVLVLLISAIFVVTIVRQLKASSVLGYLIAGILIGPHALGFFHETKTIHALGDLGVVFLMFTIGLSMPLDRLKALSRYVFGLGSAQVLITTGIIALVTMQFGFSLKQSIIIGGGLAFSSTAVVMQLLSESGELAARFGRVSFSILLFQDIAVVGFLIMLPIMANDNTFFDDVLVSTLMKASVILFAIFFIGRFLLRPVFRVVASSQTPELFTGMTLLVVFMTALATAKVGLSSELGAFIAGMLLAGSEYRHQVEADIQPFRGLLLGLFFMIVGMSIDFGILSQHVWLILLIIFSMLFGKGLILTGLSFAFNLNLRHAIRISFLLASGGEFIFILLPHSTNAGLLSGETSQILFISVALSMALTPLLGTCGRMLAEKYQPEFSSNLEAVSLETKDLTNHVIIGGYSRMGQIIAKILTENLIPFVIVDISMARVTDGRAKGVPVFFGDIRRLNVLKAIGIERAKVVLVSVDRTGGLLRTVQILRRHFPGVTVCARAKDPEQVTKLEESGAIVIEQNMVEQILQTASSVLQAAGTPREEVAQVIDNYRHFYHEKTEAS